ncbi:MAG: sensor domain-containing diguanylate cyclase [Proteobacteria bacterium]|nr:sensor domain-containing diguanylate cyclase [Pseudomonadota bacterium]MBU1688503.1 sensor domain-containing diguanylate cyclase [Pseudomonadota bacterium]
MDLGKSSFEKIVNTLHDGLYFVDRQRTITYWNQSAERISGFCSAEVVGRACSDNILTHVDEHGTCLCLEGCPLAATMEDGILREATVYMHHKDGHRIPVSVRTSPLLDDFGQIIGGVELFTDVSNMAANDLRVKELEKLALLDNLTQLANRHYLERELTSKIDEYRRNALPFGILFMDIDHFKEFNDRYGHDIGDLVLQSVANTFVINSRPFDLYGRWGGEEFIGIVRNITSQVLEHIGNRMRLLVEHAYIAVEGKELKVTISMGATLFHDDDTIDSFLKRADTLLYESKKKGRNCLTFG